MNDFSTTLKIRLWLETGEGVLLGLGRAQLLASIARHGSLNRAAKEMGMSYRAAWGRLKKTEEQLGAPLVAKQGARQSFVLTPMGEDFVKRFNAWHKDVEAFALRRAEELFPWPVRSYLDGHPPGLPAARRRRKAREDVPPPDDDELNAPEDD